MKLRSAHLTHSMLALVVLLAACTSPERSRSLLTTNVAASTIAMQLCSNCHGMKGISDSPNFPNLAAQPETYLISQLQGFRGHTRSDKDGYDYMWGITANLNDEQIAGLARYYSEQAPASRKPGSDTKVSAGKVIYEQGIAAQSVPACISCHGEHAEGNQTFPRLAGQHSEYLKKQLTVFQLTNQRPDGAVMKAITHSLSPKDMENIADYLQSISP